MTKVSESSLKATCDKVGGTFTSGGGGYSCENNCKGGVCGVYCNNKDEPCTGITPDRIRLMQGSIGEILTYVLQGGDDEDEDTVVRSPRGEAVGSMSSQSSSTQGGVGIIFY